jgi:subtilisin family serine protease
MPEEEPIPETPEEEPSPEVPEGEPVPEVPEGEPAPETPEEEPIPETPEAEPVAETPEEPIPETGEEALPEAPAEAEKKPRILSWKLPRLPVREKKEKPPRDKEKQKRILRIVGGALTGLGLLILLVLALLLMRMSRQVRGAGDETESQPQPARYGMVNFTSQADPQRVRTEGNVQFVDDELIAVSAEGVSYTEMERLCSQRDLRIIGYVELTDSYQLRLPEAHTLTGLQRRAEELEQESMVDCAMPNVVWQPGFSAVPQDPWGGQTDWEQPQAGKDNWGLAAIRAPACWERRTPGTVRVGLVDGAFDSRHEDLRYASLLRNEGERRLDSVGAVQAREHGTMVASVLGAVHDNGLGLSGVIRDCALYALGAPAYCGQMDALSAVAELSGQGVTVIQYGLGYREELVSAALAGQTDARYCYFEQSGQLSSLALQRLLGKGYDFLLVLPAGNGLGGEAADAAWSSLFASLTEPALRDRILVVGAAGIDPDGSFFPAPFSNTGARVDLLAPGVQIYCALPGNGYARRDGTSLASAHAAGAAASVWAANPGMSGAQLRALLMKTADIPVAGSGAALLDMEAAMEEAGRSTWTGGQDDRELALDAYAALLRRGVQLQLRSLPGESGALTVDAQYYYLLDMDRDGVDELLLYALNSTERCASFAIYAFRGGDVVRIADAWDTCRYASWSNVSLMLEVCDGRYVFASAAKSSTGYGESGDRYWLRFDGSQLRCTEEDLRQRYEDRVILIFNSSLTKAGVRIGSAQDELLSR